MTTVMWEVKAADGRIDELITWALAHSDPAANLYRSADGRVVVVDATGAGLPAPPDELVARPPHAWPFQPVPR